jgi:GH43 family beta-xylosidase
MRRHALILGLVAILAGPPTAVLPSAAVAAALPSAAVAAAVAAAPVQIAATARLPLSNPLNPSADPTLVLHQGAYYLSTTLGDRIGVWRSPSLAGLSSAPETVVFRDPDPGRNKQVWAPAMYRFVRPEGPRWYIYYTASDGVDANHRMYVIESAGDDPLGPYQFKGRIADFAEYAIDGEPFVHNGQMYFVWSGPGRGMGGPAQLYLQAMSSPWSTVGARVALPASGGCNEVREGATSLVRNGRTFLVYSTCDTGKPDYQLWMKSIPAGADPLQTGNWTQHPGPVFSRSDADGVYGPGHHFFFRSPDGTEDWIAYHAKTTAEYTYAGRTTRAQRFTWNLDGTPNLGRPLSLSVSQELPSGDPWRSVQGSRGYAYQPTAQQHYFDRSPQGTLRHWWRGSNPGATVLTDDWGGQLAGRPSGFAAGAEQHVFGRGVDGRLWHWWWAAGAAVRIEDWGGALAGDPVSMVVTGGNAWHVFARAADGTLAHWWRNTSDGVVRRDNWSAGKPNATIVGTPVAYGFGDEQHVFARGADNTLRHWYWYPGIPNNVPGLDAWGVVGQVHSDPTGFAYGDQQHVFYRKADGSVGHTFYDYGDAKVTSDVWGSGLAGPPTSFLYGDEQHLFGRGASGELLHWWWYPAILNNLPGHDQWGSGITADPVGFGFQDTQHVFARGGDGGLRHWQWRRETGVVADNWGGQIAG